MLNLLASISQFEREVMLERQREGVAKAKAEGKYKGRKPTARAKSDQILELDRQGLSREASCDLCNLIRFSISHSRYRS